jgi:hypothetical protein
MLSQEECSNAVELELGSRLGVVYKYSHGLHHWPSVFVSHVHSLGSLLQNSDRGSLLRLAFLLRLGRLPFLENLYKVRLAGNNHH